MTVRIAGLSRRYGNDAALAGIDLDVADGEFLALLGPSGAGKTTLLRLIAGLDQPDAGAILIDDQDVRALAPRDRRIGFVFQNYALFRHMTVARNIAFGLSVRPRRERPSRSHTQTRVEELLELMQLSAFGHRFPAQLSGGQRQRVALARALAIDPKVLLLDEPFGALDAKVRGELRDWLRALQRQLGLTTVFVTHDQHEAFQLADRIAILNSGRIEQVGTPAEIRARPGSAFIAEFLGETAGNPVVQHCGCAEGPNAFGAFAFEPGRLLPAAPVSIRSAGGEAATDQAVVGRPAPPETAGPSWTPRIVAVLPDTASATDLPSVAAGELWLIEVAIGGAELSPVEHRAVTSANVIIYDRALTDIVAGVLPLGGYAEPSIGDGAARCLQFVRDGWSVVRLVERAATPAEFTRRVRELAARLRTVAAPGELLAAGIGEGDGPPSREAQTLAEIEGLIAGIRDGARPVLRFGAFGTAIASGHVAVGSNGLAG